MLNTIQAGAANALPLLATVGAGAVWLFSNGVRIAMAAMAAFVGMELGRKAVSRFDSWKAHRTAKKLVASVGTPSPA